MRDLIRFFNDDYSWLSESISLTTGALYDPNKYDLVPKKEWFDKEVERKDRELAALEKSKEEWLRYYENKKAQTEKDKMNLLSRKAIQTG